MDKRCSKNNVIMAIESYDSTSIWQFYLLDNKPIWNFIISNDPVIEKNYYYPRVS